MAESWGTSPDCRPYPNPGKPFVTAPGVSQTILFQGDSPNGLTLPRAGNGAPGSSFDQIAIDPANRYLSPRIWPRPPAKVAFTP